jgi:sulfur-oxidizing protein SoxZ
MSKPRIRLPEQAKAGEVIEIKTLISHVMETGQRKEADGKPIPRSIINAFIAKFQGKEFFRADVHPGISANPYIAFYMKVPGPGEFEFTWVDDEGKAITEKQQLKVV